MPKGIKIGGKDWKPGQSGNPNGRPKIPPDIKELREETRSEVEALVAKYWKLPEAELDRIFKDHSTPIREKLIIRVILRGVAKGDQMTLGFLADFLFGAKPKKIEMENNTNFRISDQDSEKLKSVFREVEEEV